MALARIGVGSNAGQAAANVERAFAALSSLGRLVARSSLFRTRAWGVTGQPDFVNAAALLETGLEPRELLAKLKGIEVELGRVATFRWGPRAIDLDILAYDDVVVDEPDLVVPHARLLERAFALGPLAEIDPAFEAAFFRLPEAERASIERIGPAPARRPGVVDWDQTLERVRGAAAFCASSGLVRFRIEEDGLEIDVRRGPRAEPPAAPREFAPAHAGGAGSVTNGSVSHEVGPAASLLKAEFVGIVRLARPTVSEGSLVDDERALAYVEALGIRNPVRPAGPGRVARVFVSDGQPVEYGQPLFAIEEAR
ncbi:MAG: 2-amino-4-hydroxy-6-hydroxymethyldihydropteridine diphosphokinase [Candidatus Baltobacteraceae bacterium]